MNLTEEQKTEVERIKQILNPDCHDPADILHTSQARGAILDLAAIIRESNICCGCGWAYEMAEILDGKKRNEKTYSNSRR